MSQDTATILNLDPAKDEVSELQLQEDEKQTSQASALVAFVMKEATLFHDSNGQAYAESHSTREVQRLDSRRFKDWLVARFYLETQKSPRDQGVREAISTLSGLARQEGDCHEVNIRMGTHDGAYYLDLAEDGSSRAVELMPGKWRIIEKPPCHFIRPETMRALTYPVSGHDLNQLWDYVNIPESSRILVIAWLVECLRPDTPFPVLELFGEQGSAKSTTQRILRQLIDPNASDLRAAPKNVEDIFVCAGVNWMGSYENISHLSPSMQDALCVLSTGAGYAKRKLYSDADETVIQVKRPIILNGISVAITAQDLVDRAISIETPVISDRVEGTIIFPAFEKKRGELLGALLDIAAKALAILPSIELPAKDRPRLLEFVKLGMAISQVTTGRPKEFLDQFNAVRQEAIARSIDSSPVALALIEWCENQPGVIELSVKDLFARLCQLRPVNVDSWPRSERGLADTLRRLSPALRQLGIECTSLGKRGSRVYWQIRRR